MAYKELKAHRTVLLDLYESLGKAFDKEGDEMPGFITQRQENIAAEKFLLAIVGEVKAGKSTFINAILREAILPYDTLQATSEIVEIHHSDKKEVQVTFANGDTQAIEDDPQTPENEAVPFLKKIASINEEYRGLPIVQVNRFLIDHYSEAEGKAVFEKSELEDFIPGLENIYKLETEEFGGKIRKYIAKNIACDEIPKKVTLGYPHDFSESKHFRIVDTPGINAIGGIENQTKEFINQADAVIYLHNAKQLESKALRNALENELPERVKDRLILVLTHRSEKVDEHERILEETQRLYPKIGSDNIFFVDSLTELHLKAFYGKSMDEINAIRRQDPQLRRLTSDCVEVADGNEYDLLDRLEAQSNFTQIRERIERDAQNSASIQMKTFAGDIQEEYKVLDQKITEHHIKPQKMKYHDPQSYASDIGKLEKEMETMRSDYNNFTSELRDEFLPRDMNSRYYRKIHRIVEECRSEINEKEFDPNEHEEKNVRSYREKFLRDFHDKMTNFFDSLKADFKRRIADRNVEAQSDYSITVPIISLGSIWDTAFNEAQNEINKQLDEVEGSKGFFYYLGNIPFLGVPYLIKEGEKKEIRKSRPQKIWQKIRSSIVQQLDIYQTRLQENVGQLINNFCKDYQSKFNGELLERKRYMEELKNDKKTNEELGEEISTLEMQKKIIEDNIKMCVKIKGEL